MSWLPTEVLKTPVSAEVVMRKLDRSGIPVEGGAGKQDARGRGSET